METLPMKTNIRLHGTRGPVAALALALAAAAPASADELPPMDCVVNPSRVVDLSSAAPGLVSRVDVDRSDEVAAGQVVATLSSDVERTDLEIAAARAEMDAEVNLWRVSFDFNRRNHERLMSLHTSQAVSAVDLDKSERDAVLAQWKLRRASDAQKLHKLELGHAKEVLDLKTIRSPISGVVVRRFKSAGEYVEDQPIVRIAQLHPLHVETIVPMAFYGRFGDGMTASVFVEGHEEPVRATVAAVDRIGDAASGTFGVRLSLPNEDYRLPAGLKCHVEFDAAPKVADESPRAPATGGTRMQAPGPGQGATAASAPGAATVASVSSTDPASLGPILKVRR